MMLQRATREHRSGNGKGLGGVAMSARTTTTGGLPLVHGMGWWEVSVVRSIDLSIYE